jgi:AcrR family transcriptional regulator
MEVKNRAANKKVEQGDQTRKALIREAGSQFAERGYAGTSIEGVARAAGLTKGALYHHFRDKTELFEAALAKRVRTLGKTSARLSRDRVLGEGAERRGWERIVAGLHVFFDQLADPEVHKLILVDGPAVLGRERWDRVWIENSLTSVRRILRGTEQYQGVASEHLEPLARMLLGGIQEAAQSISASADPVAAREAFEGSLLWLLGAIYRQAEEDARAAD